MLNIIMFFTVMFITLIITLVLAMHGANKNSIVLEILAVIAMTVGCMILLCIPLPIEDIYPASYTAKINDKTTDHSIMVYNADATKKNMISFYIVYKNGDTTVPYGEITTIPYSEFDMKNISNRNDFPYIKSGKPFICDGFCTGEPYLVIPDKEYEAALKDAGNGKIVKGGSLDQ